MRLQVTITSGTCKSLMTKFVVPWDALTTFAGRQAAKIIQTAPAHRANKTEEQEKKGVWRADKLASWCKKIAISVLLLVQQLHVKFNV